MHVPLLHTEMFETVNLHTSNQMHLFRSSFIFIWQIQIQ